MFTGKFCSNCGKYDSVLIKENYPKSNYRCPNCEHEWVEIDSILGQWVEKTFNRR